MAASETPLWVWGLLIAAVFGVSSAGALFQSVDTVPPLLRASWRLQLTALVLFPLFLQQIATIEPAIMEQVKTRRTLLLLFGSGLALAAHFGAWVASLDETTLTLPAVRHRPSIGDRAGDGGLGSLPRSCSPPAEG